MIERIGRRHRLMTSWLFSSFVFFTHFPRVFSIECNGLQEEYGCDTNENGSMAVCSGGLYDIDEIRNFILSTLLLCSWPTENFNSSILSIFWKMESFTLFRSPVKQITLDFPVVPFLKVLNMSYNQIEFLSSTVFLKLKSLTVLDLRVNKLRQFNPTYVADLPQLKEIHLLGNQWDCNRNFSWIVHQNCSVCSIINGTDSLMCSGNMYKNKPLKPVMWMLQTLNHECAEISDYCTCVLDHVVRIGSTLRPMITVNCSYQDLHSLPLNLPNFTSTLIMKGNKISDLTPFLDNEKYLNLLNAYLDYNNISSIEILEDSSWLLTFRALSLRGNKLIEVPVYALESSFEKNPNIGNLFLSENPWKCDCIFTPVFQTFLAKYRAVIKDVDNVKCLQKKHGDESMFHILSLSRNKICHENSKISTWNILNLGLAALLAVVLCDFVYNCYMYKRHGKLPWIINKLP